MNNEPEGHPRGVPGSHAPADEGLARIPEPPEGPPEDDLTRAHYQAQLDEHAASEALDRDKNKLEAETEWALTRVFHEALMDVSKASVGGANARAESVRTAAGAIGVIYTGVLGLSFSVSDNPLPLRGVVPALFLGIAMLMATAYIAYPVEPAADTDWPEGGRASAIENQQERTTAFMKWAAGTVRAGEYALRAAVISLGFGIIFLPVAFVSFQAPQSAVTGPSTLDWPEPPSLAGDPSLQAILYEAQVSEVAALRRAARDSATPESWDDWRVRGLYITATAALVVIFAHPLFLRRPKRSPRALSSPPPDVH
jgi:hypothetical protein